MRQVLADPRNYLNVASDAAEVEHFVVIGGGMAGLTSAYLLLQLGHQVTMFESDSRLGGRAYTVYKKDKDGKQWYGDMGAMRFPYHNDAQPIINKVKL